MSQEAKYMFVHRYEPIKGRPTSRFYCIINKQYELLEAEDYLTKCCESVILQIN